MSRLRRGLCWKVTKYLCSANLNGATIPVLTQSSLAYLSCWQHRHLGPGKQYENRWAGAAAWVCTLPRHSMACVHSARVTLQKHSTAVWSFLTQNTEAWLCLEWTIWSTQHICLLQDKNRCRRGAWSLNSQGKWNKIRPLKQSSASRLSTCVPL